MCENKLMQDLVALQAKFMSLFRFAAIGGFLVVSVLLINLNFKMFEKMLEKNFALFKWIFLLSTIFPLLLILYAFSFFFEK